MLMVINVHCFFSSSIISKIYSSSGFSEFVIKDGQHQFKAVVKKANDALKNYTFFTEEIEWVVTMQQYLFFILPPVVTNERREKARWEIQNKEIV